MGNIAPQRHEKCVSEVINVKVDMRGVLDTGELLSGTPTVAEVDGTDLTIQNNIVNTATLTINDDTVAVGEAVQFRVSGGVAGTTYTIRITVSTDSSPAQTRIQKVIMKVVVD